jgi:hypothetical protein
MAHVFISHISEEKLTAESLKSLLARDFLGLLRIFLSSDTQSIAVGKEWLKSVEEALNDAALMVVLCSGESVRRPWINFEAGAAWMRKIPIIPICHAGLSPSELAMPLSLRQGLAINDPDGLKRLYQGVTEKLSCEMPATNFVSLAQELSGINPQPPPTGSTIEEAIRQRLEWSLNHPDYQWRSLESVAVEAGISEEKGAEFLRTDKRVRFGIGKSGNRIVGLVSRVGAHRK